MPLTKRQSEILAYLQHHIQDQGYAPSFEEIAERFGFQSLATVHEHLTNLERKGYIRRSYNESRSIEVLPPRGTGAASEIPLLGKVAAGTPIESLMHQETIAVPDQMLPRRGPNYALRVQGTSMIDEHIMDGDVVVVHGKQTAENGEMVIALVNGSEATVKKFYREPGGWIRLQPANATMQPIYVEPDACQIQGVVVGVTDHGDGLDRTIAMKAFEQPFSTGEATEATGSKGTRYSFRTGTDTYSIAAASIVTVCTTGMSRLSTTTRWPSPRTPSCSPGPPRH